MIPKLCFFLFTGLAVAAPPTPWTITATASRTALWVGDRFQYVVRLEHRPELEFVSDHLGKDELNVQPFEVIESSTESGALPGGRKFFELRLVLTTYAVAAQDTAIPTITLFYFDKSRSQNKDEVPAETLRVPAFPIAVRSVVVDPASGIRDRKPPLILPRRDWLLPLILGLCGLAILALVMIRTALAQLHSGFWKARRAERIRKRSLSGSMREIRGIPAGTPAELQAFYDKASEILRGLAAEKLSDGAGLTPAELKRELTARGDAERHASVLSELLEECESIRYAPDSLDRGREHYTTFVRKFEELAGRR